MPSDDDTEVKSDENNREKFQKEKPSGSQLTRSQPPSSQPSGIQSSDSQSSGLTFSQVEEAIINAHKSVNVPHHIPYHTIQPFLPGSSFRAYEDRLKQYFIVNDVKDEQKVPLFITISGGEIYETLSSFTTPDLPSQKSFNELMKLLNDHFSPRLNKRSERAKFHRLYQHNGENVKEFSIRLQKAAQTCNFGDFLDKDPTKEALKFKRWALDEQLTDQFIVGLHAEKTRQVLINNDPKDYQSCFQLAVNMEMSDRESKQFSSHYVNQICRQKSSPQSSPQSSSPRFIRRFSSKSTLKRSNSLPALSEKHGGFRNCPHCKWKHDPTNCPAKKWTCYSCQKVGHTSRVCTAGKPKIQSISSISSEAPPHDMTECT